jgi:hypothetical protein
MIRQIWLYFNLSDNLSNLTSQRRASPLVTEGEAFAITDLRIFDCYSILLYNWSNWR